MWSQIVLLVLGVSGAAAVTLPDRAEPPAATTSTSSSTTTTTQIRTETRPPVREAAAPSSAAIAVRSVTDGDTIVLVDNRRVRLAQVDAPETSDCFGSQSTEALRALIGEKPVTLRRPSNGPEKDQYGRTLAEISVEGVSLNEVLVRSGAAEWYEEFANEDADIARRLKSAEDEARQAGRGLWSACRGPATATPTATPAPLRAVPTPTSAPRPTPAPTTGTCHPAYPSRCIPPAPPDLDCPDIAARVTVDHRHGDPHRFDADGDGVGCESYG